MKLPALAEMVLLEFKNLIEFRTLNVEGFVQLWDKDFKLGKWLNGIKTDLINEDQEKNFLAEIIVYITVAGVFIICIAVGIVLKKFGN